jgi:hypothetical protein
LSTAFICQYFCPNEPWPDPGSGCQNKSKRGSIETPDKTRGLSFYYPKFSFFIRSFKFSRQSGEPPEGRHQKHHGPMFSRRQSVRENKYGKTNPWQIAASLRLEEMRDTFIFLHGEWWVDSAESDRQNSRWANLPENRIHFFHS